jgi:hypothetical protein
MRPQASSPPACGGKHQTPNSKPQTAVTGSTLHARRLILPALLASLLALTVCEEVDDRAPTVLSAYPASGATGVPINARIQVTFSEAMNAASAEAAFTIAPATAGSFEWAGNVLHWAPAQNLAAQTAYTFAVETSAHAVTNRRLDGRLDVTFTTGDDTAAFVPVIMLGRSVMGGWFTHWGGSPHTQDRFTLEYHEVQSPPEIVAGARAVIDSLIPEEQPVVFFKLCFVDFEGGDSATAQANLDRNFGYVEQVYDVAKQAGVRLVVGNALPQVVLYHDQWLVWNHRQYNQRLLDLAALHPDSVAVFDMYSVLSDAAGDLKPAYASWSDDSHPNEAGYAALDAAFFPFLEQHY